MYIEFKACFLKRCVGESQHSSLFEVMAGGLWLSG